MVWITLTAAAALALACWILSHVEDWSRDFRTNWARLDDACARSPDLRPQSVALPPERLIAAVQEWTAREPRWQTVETRQIGATWHLHLVHTTPLMRFKDDVRVFVREEVGGSRVEAESRSRIGRGDLGQNPRNLKLLVAQLRSIESNATPTPRPT